MRRPYPPKATSYRATTGDISTELSPGQLQAIGLVAMRFNQVEEQIESLFYTATGISPDLSLEVMTRIGGIDGKIAIILAGSKPLLPAQYQTQLENALGKGIFGLLKQCRDSIIHARVHHAPLGIGVRIDRKARLYEILLTEDALTILSIHLAVLRTELAELNDHLWMLSIIKAAKNPEEEKLRFELQIEYQLLQLLDLRSQRESLPPLPTFPSEQELLESRHNFYTARIADLMSRVENIPEGKQ